MRSHFCLEVAGAMPGADVDGLLRSAVAAMCLAAGVLHVSAAADHRGMGAHVAFFVLVAVGQTALAAALVWARPAGWLSAAALGNLAVAGVWVLSRTTGLSVDGSSVPEAIGFKDGITTLLELGAVAGAGMWWLLPASARRLPLQSRRLASVMLGTGVWALGASGLFAGHTHSAGHTHGAAHDHGAPQADHGASRHDAEPGQLDHGHGAETVAASAPTAGGAHHHDGGAEPAAPSAAHYHHSDGGIPRVSSAPAADAQDHAHHGVSEASPVPQKATGHRHAGAGSDPGPADEGKGEGHDHDHDGHGQAHGDDGHGHDHNHEGSGNDRNDDGSALDQLLKLIQPR